MENMFQKDIMRGRGGNKQPSRLQRQAPATLQLDPTGTGNNNNNNPFSLPPGDNTPYTNCPIPLLSPLVLTPPPLPMPSASPQNDDSQVAVILDQGGSHHHDNKPRKGTDDQTGSSHSSASASSLSSSNAGWEHPAAPASAFIDPSSLIPFFQSQCVLVHHIQ